MGDCAIAQALTDAVVGTKTNFNVGDSVTYTLTGAPAFTASTTVTVTNVLAAGLTFVTSTASVGTYDSAANVWNVGTLNGAGYITLAITATVNAGTEGQTIATNPNINFVRSDCTQSSAVAGNTITVASAGTSTSTTPSADISISKIADVASTTMENVSSTVNYTITVTNMSTSTTSTNVVATDILPSELTFESATTTVGTSSYASSTGTETWTISALAPSATATLMIAAAVNTSTLPTIWNTATVSASTTDANPSNNSSSAFINVQQPGCTSNCGGGGGGGGGSAYANVSIVKTVDNANPTTGSTINYTLVVKDNGQSATFGVVADDVLPAGVAFVSASSSEGSYASSTGVWTIGALNIGQTATLTIVARVTAPSGTAITNTGTVSESPTIIDSLSSDNTSSVTINVAGNAGGGTGGVGGGGQVLGASTSTGQVLGASCGLYLTSYIHPLRKDLNDPAQVKKLQVFLNMNLGLNLPITGYYSDATIAAVNQFQVKYHIEVLKPWVPLGLSTQFTPTSYVYQTTQRWINLIMCPPLNILMPTLHVDNNER